jgi:hypothetical protein
MKTESALPRGADSTRPIALDSTLDARADSILSAMADSTVAVILDSIPTSADIPFCVDGWVIAIVVFSLSRSMTSSGFFLGCYLY